jgi:hypothetical protein
MCCITTLVVHGFVSPQEIFSLRNPTTVFLDEIFSSKVHLMQVNARLQRPRSKRHSASQNVLWLLSNLKYHYLIHCSSTVKNITRRINLFRIIVPHFLKSFLISRYNLCLCSPSRLRFSTKILYAFLISEMCAICPSHLVFLDQRNKIWWREETWSSLIS